MELYKELLINALARKSIAVYFPNLQIDAERIIEGACYNALQKIKTIIADDSLTDSECFMKIEKIISVLEQSGSGGGGRHDF